VARDDTHPKEYVGWLHRYLLRCRLHHIKPRMAESATEIKLFGKWSLDDVEINDISLVVSLLVNL
jgi:hypothetical protein